MKVVMRLLVVGLLISFFVLPARAAEFRTSEESIIISDNQKPHNLYLAGKNITVDAATTGDLVIAGGTVLSNGEVENSLFITGGTVTVRSHVKHHLRIAGGTVTLSGKVDGDVFVAGGDVILADSAEIAGGLYVASGTLTVAGKVNGELRIGSGRVVIDGSVGPANIYGDEIKLTSKAKVNGNFSYHSSKTASIDPASVITGQTNYTKYQTAKFDKYGLMFGATFTLGYLLRLLGAILLGWLLIRFWPRSARKIVDFAFSAPLAAIGFGLLHLFIVFFAGLVLMFTIVGMSIAGIVFAVWFLLLLVGSIAGKIILGAWLYRLIKHETDYQLTISTVSLGVVVGSLLMLVPVIGMFVVFITFLLGVGGTFNLMLKNIESTTTKSVS